MTRPIELRHKVKRSIIVAVSPKERYPEWRGIPFMLMKVDAELRRQVEAVISSAGRASKDRMAGAVQVRPASPLRDSSGNQHSGGTVEQSREFVGPAFAF